MAYNTNFAAKALEHYAAEGNVSMAAIAADALANAPSREDLIREAGLLNNNPKLVNTDHVSIMGMLDRDECERHVEKLRKMVA